MSKPFFIIGAFRSGTTAIAKILNLASNATVHVEQAPKLSLESRQLYEGKLDDPLSIIRQSKEGSIAKDVEKGLIYADKNANSMDTEGITIVRPMHVYGYDDGYTGHPELNFENVVVPKSNIIGGEGMGFKIAQARLGPGRIHHCMRTIGMAERALQLMIKRALSRETFGTKISDHGVVQDWIARSRIKIEEARLLTLKTAWLIDNVGKEQAKIEISAIKVGVIEAASYVIDKAIQAHGAMGVSQDTPLAKMSAGVRTLRIADGPDEVHLRSIARREINKHT